MQRKEYEYAFTTTHNAEGVETLNCEGKDGWHLKFASYECETRTWHLILEKIKYIV